MAMFMCRWPNGDLSFVLAPNKEEAIVDLDEWGNAELAQVKRIPNFMADFRLTENGDLEFVEFGEVFLNFIWEVAFPIVAKARENARGNGDEPTAAGLQKIRDAVAQEKKRLGGKEKLKAADTELGRSIQRQTGAPAALVNRQIKRRATEVLRNLPTDRQKH